MVSSHSLPVPSTFMFTLQSNSPNREGPPSGPANGGAGTKHSLPPDSDDDKSDDELIVDEVFYI